MAEISSVTQVQKMHYLVLSSITIEELDKSLGFFFKIPERLQFRNQAGTTEYTLALRMKPKEALNKSKNTSIHRLQC
jgi:hypothetical protein